MLHVKRFCVIVLYFIMGALSFRVVPCVADVTGKSATRALNFRYRKPALFVTASFSGPDGFINDGQTAQIVAVVSNNGAGKAYDVRGYLTGEVPDGLFVQRGAVLGTILPGQSKQLCFSLNTVENLPSKSVPLKLLITEKYGQCPMTMSIDLSCYSKISSQRPEKTSITTAESYDHLIDSIPNLGRSQPHGVAVIIGNRDYDATGPGLYDYAHKDADAMKVCLKNVFGYLPENIIHRRNARRGDFIEVFGSAKKPGLLAKIVLPDTTDLVIYYSGRGFTDGKSSKRYLLPVECNYGMKKLPKACYSLDLLLSNIAELSPRSVTIVFETCFENYPAQEADIILTSQTLSVSGNPVVFLAAGNGESSNRYHEAMQGLFTDTFIRTISELAQEGAVPITAGAIIDRLNDESSGIPFLAQSIFNGKQQHPVVYGNRELLMIR